MLFNSIGFAIFLVIVFSSYWLVRKSLAAQNALLLVASYFFYSVWDYRFLFLLIFSTLLDFFSGLMIGDSENHSKRKLWLWISITINLGFLGVFKYYNFFADSFADLLSLLGFQSNPLLLELILPVGISFYTFHGLSYVIDIYYKRIPVERNFADYAVFVSFFPLLVAGPIERATHLLPQIKQPRTFNYHKAVDGLRQILWGLFKKIVIADNCAETVNFVFNNSSSQSGSTLIVGAVLFAFQIYCDFSGYSDIALGTARLFGIELLRNFAFPYFSRDIAEFWRRWHISLSSWFRDYVYFPLGGSRGSMLQKVRNTFIIFLLSGFWHGANWTFIAWGALNAIYFMPLLLQNKNRHHLATAAEGRMLPSTREFFSIVTTFGMTTLAWIFFRSESIAQALGILRKIFSRSSLSIPEVGQYWLIPVLLVFIVVEWIGRFDKYAIETSLMKTPRVVRWSFYYGLSMMILLLSGEEKQFIYFQF
jgi:alginate O-acetyltransferase complex protein AlgI